MYTKAQRRPRQLLHLPRKPSCYLALFVVWLDRRSEHTASIFLKPNLNPADQSTSTHRDLQCNVVGPHPIWYRYSFSNWCTLRCRLRPGPPKSYRSIRSINRLLRTAISSVSPLFLIPSCTGALFSNWCTLHCRLRPGPPKTQPQPGRSTHFYYRDLQCIDPHLVYLHVFDLWCELSCCTYSSTPACGISRGCGH